MARESKGGEPGDLPAGEYDTFFAAVGGAGGARSPAVAPLGLEPLVSSTDPDSTPSAMAYSGRLGGVRGALEAIADPAARLAAMFGSSDADRRSLFHWAAAGGRDEVLTHLLHTAAELRARVTEAAGGAAPPRTIAAVLNSRDEGGITPLASAAAAGSAACVTALLDHGADANAATAGGQLPLHYHKGRVPVIAALLGATRDLDAADRAGATALHRAAGPGHVAAVDALLAAGAKPNPRDRAGNTPLHLAAEEGRLEVVQRLLEHGANPRIRNGEGKDATAVVADGAVRARVAALVRSAAAAAGP